MRATLLLFLLAIAAPAEIVGVHGGRVTIRYDFEDPRQLDDFEIEGKARVEKGKLIVEGAVHHKHAGATHARFTVTAQGEFGGAWSKDPFVLPRGNSVGCGKDGAIETIRVDGSWKQRAGKETGAARFGLWTKDGAAVIDDLYITLDKSDLRPARDPRLIDEKESILVKRVKSGPLSAPGLRAAREMAARGPKSLKKLGATARTLGRKKPYAILEVIRVLGEVDDPEARAQLAALYKKIKSPDVRVAVAYALAPSYPEHKTLVHEQLAGQRELFRALVWRGLDVKPFFDDPEFADEAYQVSRMRGVESDGEFGKLPRLLSKKGHRRPDALRFAHDFAESPDWPLLIAMTKLLADKDERVAHGAYLLLLTVSDKDIAPDADLWLSWISAKRAAYKPPEPGDAGPVAAAILRARAYIRKDLLEDGACEWPTSPDWPATRVGATALAVYAVCSAGLPKDDPAVKKAMETMFPGGAMRGDLDRYTYALCMLAMALEAVDRTGYIEIKKTLARQLVQGQLENGQWTYYCRRPGYDRRAKRGDNSNTQFAILGLRSLRRCGVKIDPKVFEKTVGHFLGTRNAYGGWGYGDKSFKNEMSMTAAGISTLAICAEAIHGPAALRNVKSNNQVGSGQRRLGELLLNDGYKGQEIYTLYGVERACILTDTRAFNDFDWYKVGAKQLVLTQQDAGTWGDNTVKGVDTGRGYGKAVDTCFALLFLKRSTTGLAGADGDGVVKIPKHRRPSKPR